MQPVPKAAYRSDFRENANCYLQLDSNLDRLAQQASVLPLDHCDLLIIFVITVVSSAGVHIAVSRRDEVPAAHGERKTDRQRASFDNGTHL